MPNLKNDGTSAIHLFSKVKGEHLDVPAGAVVKLTEEQASALAADISFHSELSYVDALNDVAPAKEPVKEQETAAPVQETIADKIKAKKLDKLNEG